MDDIANQFTGDFGNHHILYSTLSHMAYNSWKSHISVGCYCFDWMNISAKHKKQYTNILILHVWPGNKDAIAFVTTFQLDGLI